METFLHLSIPVTELDAALTFYVDTLGCASGRIRRDQGFADVWFYGMQVSLHDEPEQVRTPAEQGVLHFGVTLARADLDALIARLDGQLVEWASPLHTDYAGTPQERTKAKIVDPSGNVIEVKSYADVESAFG